MPDFIETKRSGVVMTRRFPVMPVILMAFAVVCALIPLIGNIAYQGFFSHLYVTSMLLVFAGLVLHKVKMQVLAGIGTLIIAAYNLYTAFEIVYFFSKYGFEMGIIINLFVNLLAVAAFTVSGLHYVLKRPKPGKSAKLILMIPLSCMWIIQMIVRVISIATSVVGFNPVFIILSYLSDVLMAFALMIYTPFREV